MAIGEQNLFIKRLGKGELTMMIRTYKNLIIGGESLPDNVELWVEMDGVHNVARFVQTSNESAVDLTSRSGKRYSEIEAVLELLEVSFELSVAMQSEEPVNTINVPVFYSQSDDNLAKLDRDSILLEVNKQIDLVEKAINASRKPFNDIEQ